jgi:hypothetical protein
MSPPVSAMITSAARRPTPGIVPRSSGQRHQRPACTVATSVGLDERAAPQEAER